MAKQVVRAVASGAMVLGLLLPATRSAVAQAVTPAPKLDLNRYVGVWYEEARYPNKQEKACIGDAEVLYALADKAGRLQIVNTCQLKDGSSNVRNVNGRVADKLGDGKLKVTSIWPCTRPYWVLAVGPDYEWVLVGTPNRKTLWILSRTPVLQPEVLTQIEAKAAAEGFNTAKLITVTRHH